MRYRTVLFAAALALATVGCNQNGASGTENSSSPNVTGLPSGSAEPTATTSPTTDSTATPNPTSTPSAPATGSPTPAPSGPPTSHAEYEKAAGTYKFDPNSLKITPVKIKVTPQIQKDIEETEKTYKAAFIKFTLTLRSDGSYTGVEPDGKTQNGTYKVVKGVLKLRDPKQPDVVQPDFTFSSDYKTLHRSLADQDPRLDLDLVKQ